MKLLISSLLILNLLPILTNATLLNYEALKKYCCYLDCKGVTVISSEGLDYETSDKGITLMPSGAGRWRKFILNYKYQTEIPPSQCTAQLFFPFSDEDLVCPELDMSATGINFPGIPVEQSHRMKSATVTESWDVAVFKKINIAQKNKRAVAVLLEEPEDDHIKATLIIFFDKTGSEFLKLYRNAVKRYMAECLLNLIAEKYSDVVVTGFAGVLLHHPNEWENFNRTEPLSSISVTGENTVKKRFLEDIKAIVRLPDSLVWRDCESGVKVLFQGAGSNAQALWECQFDDLGQITGASSYHLSGQTNPVCVADKAICFSQAQIWIRSQLDAELKQKLLGKLMTVTGAVGALTAMAPVRVQHPKALPRSKEQIIETQKLLNRLKGLDVQYDELINKKLKRTLHNANSIIQTSFKATLQKVRKNNNERWLSIRDKRTTSNKRAPTTMMDSDYNFLKSWLAFSAGLTRCEIDHKKIKQFQTQCMNWMIDSSRPSSAYRLATDDYQLIFKLMLQASLLESGSLCGKGSWSDARIIIDNIGDMLPLLEQKAYLDDKKTGALFLYCINVLTNILLVSELDYRAVRVDILDVFNSVEKILLWRADRHQYSRIISCFPDSLSSTGLCQRAAHMMTHHWLVLHYLLDRDNTALLKDILYLLQTVHTHSAWGVMRQEAATHTLTAGVSMPSQPVELLSNACRIMAEPCLLEPIDGKGAFVFESQFVRRNLVFLSRLCCHQLEKFTPGEIHLIEELIPLLPAGNELTGLVYEGYNRVLNRLGQQRHPPPVVDPRPALHEAEQEVVTSHVDMRTYHQEKAGQTRTTSQAKSKKGEQGRTHCTQAKKKGHVSSGQKTQPKPQQSKKLQEACMPVKPPSPTFPLPTEKPAHNLVEKNEQWALVSEQADRIYRCYKSGYNGAIKYLIENSSHTALVQMMFADLILYSSDHCDRIKRVKHRLQQREQLGAQCFRWIQRDLDQITTWLEACFHYFTGGAGELTYEQFMELEAYITWFYEDFNSLKEQVSDLGAQIAEIDHALSVMKPSPEITAVRKDIQVQHSGLCGLGLGAIYLRRSMAQARLGPEALNEAMRHIKEKHAKGWGEQALSGSKENFRDIIGEQKVRQSESTIPHDGLSRRREHGVRSWSQTSLFQSPAPKLSEIMESEKQRLSHAPPPGGKYSWAGTTCEKASRVSLQDYVLAAQQMPRSQVKKKTTYNELEEQILAYQKSHPKSMHEFSRLETFLVQEGRLSAWEKHKLYNLLNEDDGSNSYVFTLGGGNSRF